MKLTVDSNEPLEDAIRVVGSLYGVTLVVADDEHGAAEPAQMISRKPKKRAARTVPRSRAVVVTDARSRTSRATTAEAAGAPSSADIRSWARHTGLSVSGRGRVPASVITAYNDAHR